MIRIDAMTPARFARRIPDVLAERIRDARAAFEVSSLAYLLRHMAAAPAAERRPALAA